MRAEWVDRNGRPVHLDRPSVRYLVVGHLQASIGLRHGGDYFWHIPGTNSIGTVPDEAAAKLAAETELRRLASEMVRDLGGTVTWGATGE